MIIMFSMVVCLAAMVQASIGFGFTPITMVFMPGMIGYNKAVAVSLIIIFVSTVIVSFRYRSYVQWKLMLPLLIPTFLFNIIAVVISSGISADFMYILLGFMLTAIAVFFFVFSDRVKFKPTIQSGILLGIICGVAYGFFATGGPAASLYFTSAIDDKDEYMGTMQMFLCINNGLGVFLRILNGSLVLSDAPLVGLGWLFMCLGTILGLLIFKHFSNAMFKKVIYAFVGLNGVWIVISKLLL